MPEMTPERLAEIDELIASGKPASMTPILHERAVKDLRAALAESQAGNERLKMECSVTIDTLAEALFGSEHFTKMKDSCRAEFALDGEGAAQIIRRWREQLIQTRKDTPCPKK